MMVNNAVEWMWKEAVLAYINPSYWNNIHICMSSLPYQQQSNTDTPASGTLSKFVNHFTVFRCHAMTLTRQKG
jgi:hypothetical protein